MKSNLLNFISLTKKSGSLKKGEFATIEAIKMEQAKVLIVAEDASEGTKKKFKDKCEYRDIPLLFFSTKEELGRAIGEEFTASIALCDKGLAKAFLDKYRRYLNGKNESI